MMRTRSRLGLFVTCKVIFACVRQVDRLVTLPGVISGIEAITRGRQLVSGRRCRASSFAAWPASLPQHPCRPSARPLCGGPPARQAELVFHPSTNSWRAATKMMQRRLLNLSFFACNAAEQTRLPGVVTLVKDDDRQQGSHGFIGLVARGKRRWFIEFF